MTTIEAEISVDEFRDKARDFLAKNARKRGE